MKTTRRQSLQVIGGAAVGRKLIPFTNENRKQASANSEWSMFQVDAANTGRSLTGSGPTEHIWEKWNFSTDDRITATPVITNGKVIFGSQDGTVRSLSTSDGSVEWVFEIKSDVEGVSSSPALSGNTIIVPGDDALYGLSIEDGTEKWSYNPDKIRDYNSPAIVENTIFTTAGDKIIALNADDGTEEWRFEMAHDARGGPAVNKGTLYAVTSELGGDHNYVYAINTEDGNQQWRYDLGIYSQVTHAPTVADDVVYIGPSGPSQSILTALAADGSGELWSKEMSSDIDSSVAVDNDTIYVHVRDGNLYALDVGTGHEKWRIEREAYSSNGSANDSAPVLIGDVIYVGGYDETVKAISTQTESIQWEFNIGSRILSSPAVINDTIYIGANDGNLYTLISNKPPNGTFSYEPTSPTVGTPVTFDATGSEDDGEIVEYKWDFDDDGEFEKSGTESEFTFTKSGNHTVRLKITDNYGATDESKTTIRVIETDTDTKTPTSMPSTTRSATSSTTRSATSSTTRSATSSTTRSATSSTTRSATSSTTRSATSSTTRSATSSTTTSISTLTDQSSYLDTSNCNKTIFICFLTGVVMTILSTEALVALATALVIILLVLLWEKQVENS